MPMKRPLLKSKFSLRHYSLSSENVLKTGGILKQTRTFLDFDIAEYSKLTHDSNPLHSDLKCAKQAGFTEIPLSPEMLVASLFPRIIACHFPWAVYVKQELNFRSPVFIGDKVVGEVEAKNIRQIKEFCLVKFVTTCFKDGEIVVIGSEAMAMLPTLSIKKT
ncbi:3-hydroxyacyl-[acyl-carrier-protein] dehydratase FERN, mitochondrial-like [Primulina tabacum]|uniref:3-hydroxyacyl-[acyl-carrier-protein] dehydratase FERN, mitochondrial-like n=1 Tax=Primulina tabacum TaxID=48773 RepID=UPI003F5A9F67